jgi:rare lipoprotein A (peptidoglycan hydrolase)
MTLLATILATIAAHPPDHPAPMRTAIASWYAEHGPGACNLGPDVQTGYRFASLILRCGTRIRICRNHHCVTATMADHGPYITGRTFDLNYQLSDALNCPGICTVRWRIA